MGGGQSGRVTAPVVPPVITGASGPTTAARRRAVFFKIAGIVLLIAALHVPLAMTEGVLRERQAYRGEAVENIAATWGGRQLVTGPVLVVPWTQTHTRVRESRDGEGKVTRATETYETSGQLFFLPEEMKVAGEVSPEIRYRGIHEVVVYAATLAVECRFRAVPADSEPSVTPQWGKARLVFGLADLRRLRAAPVARWNETEVTVEAAPENPGLGLGLAMAAPLRGPGEDGRLVLQLALQGSERLEIAPAGRQTEVELKSAWAEPSFTGLVLPAARTVTAEGFVAAWSQGPFGRDYPATWNSRNAETGEILKKLNAGAFGVALQMPVDGYRLSERAQKYGVLFFVLVFAVFFLFELTAGLRIHPLQYAMVGAALCLFFLGFLALAEFLSAGLAYAVAAAACTAMISLYALSFLRSGWRTLAIGGGLAATYAYLYFVLRSQDYALLAGTLALFAVLALVMFCTRRVRWYAVDLSAPDASGEGRAQP